MISPGRLWWLLKRDMKRGLSASYHDYKIRPLIQKWNWPFWNDAPMSVPVHVLTGEKDWQLCAWMLASFFHHTEHTWNVVIHDDGTLTEEIRREFSALFKTARIIPRAQADATLDAVLKPLPFAYEYRGMHPLALKIFDMPYYCEAPRFIMLDSDVLFFNHPREIMDWVGSGAKECWFNEDIAEGSLLPASDAIEDLGVKLWPRVNSGIALITKEAIDFEFCDRARPELHAEILDRVFFREQAAFRDVFIEPAFVRAAAGPVHDFARVVEEEHVTVEHDEPRRCAVVRHVENLQRKRVHAAVFVGKGEGLQDRIERGVRLRARDDPGGFEQGGKLAADLFGECAVVVDDDVPRMLCVMEKAREHPCAKLPVLLACEHMHRHGHRRVIPKRPAPFLDQGLDSIVVVTGTQAAFHFAFEQPPQPSR